MMKKETIDSIKNILAIGFFCFLFALFIYDYFRGKEINENPKYTIGITYSSVVYSRGSHRVFYKYSVNKIQYDKSSHYSSDSILIIPNGRYYVVFSSLDPEKGEMLTNKSVPDSIKEAPLLGWDKLPE